MMMSMGSGEASISSIAQDTNGVTLTFTSTYSSATSWDLFTTLDLVTQPTWDLLKTDIVITNAVTTTWLDEDDTQEHLFYALGTAEDCDGDSVRDGLEALVYHTHIEDVTEGLVAWWKFDEERGIISADQINTNHGTIYGTTASASQFGPIGRAMVFAGEDDPDDDPDGAKVPDSPSLTLSNAITLSAWIYPSVSNSDYQAVFQKNGAYYLNVRSGKPQFYWYGLSVEGYHTASDPLPTLSWSHVAAT
ncbi:MAG: LamG domain-containing protein, partial [Verrucomicrobia bacterium]|nr:LamG domain-containing protein [Verrucomicrobiota bacterium]